MVSIKYLIICICTFSLLLSSSFRYKGNDQNQITTDSDDPHHIVVSENVLTVNRFIESDAGIYKCSLVDSNTGVTLNKKEFNLACEYIELSKKY